LARSMPSGLYQGEIGPMPNSGTYRVLAGCNRRQTNDCVTEGVMTPKGRRVSFLPVTATAPAKVPTVTTCTNHRSAPCSCDSPALRPLARISCQPYALQDLPGGPTTYSPLLRPKTCAMLFISLLIAGKHFFESFIQRGPVFDSGRLGGHQWTAPLWGVADYGVAP
jgi:hypothetical protein